MEVTVPNLNYFIDWDGDGIAGNEPDAGGDVTLTLIRKNWKSLLRAGLSVLR